MATTAEAPATAPANEPPTGVSVAPPEKKYTSPVRITYKDPVVTQEAVEAANEINVWHKFILFNVEKSEKNEILDSLIVQCAPMLLVPVMYKLETPGKATFLSFCRSNTVQKLSNSKMQIKLSSGKIINYDIVLSFLPFKDMQLNPQLIITNVISIRYGREPMTKKNLNLGNFTNDPLLGSIYCPIHIPLVFDNVLRFSRALSIAGSNRDPKIPVKGLILKNNKMDSIAFTEKVFSSFFTKLDLRNNLLNSLDALKPFTEYKITEVWLDGNPLCDKFTKPKDYIAAVKSVFPYLQILDGMQVTTTQIYMPISHKHFMHSGRQTGLVQQFVEHFFNCYDQDDRIVLNGLYDAGAFFSMTVGQIHNNDHQQIIKSFAAKRNLLKCVDYAKYHENLLHGPEKIISALRREPPTLHKMKYLDIDLIYSIKNCFAVTIQGPYVYRKSKALPLWFHRTLVVAAKDDNEFCIINDQYHICNCPSSLNNIDLSELNIITERSIPQFNPISFSMPEKQQLLKLLQELTTMNPEFSDKFLKEANWDVRQAIKSFMQTYVNNKIPPEAFWS